MGSVFDLMATLSLDSSQYSTSLTAAEGQATGFGTKTGGVLSTFGNKAKLAMAAAGAAVVGFGVSSVKVAADFGSSMSQVAATMGMSTAELHDSSSQAAQDFQKLSDFAKKMGATTKFSSAEAADALNYMALAGYDATTSMDMLPTVLNLAAAGNMDLAYASDVVTDAQSALGLSLEETKTLVDQMAKSSSITNTSVSQLGEALLTVGGTAKIMAGGTAEASAALGLLASAGIKGSEGGTALRNILLGISSKKFDKTFGALGVSAYDAEGNMRELKDVVLDMNAAMEGMTIEQQTELVSAAFNKLDLKSVNALLGVTAEQWDEVTAAIKDSAGAAEEMAHVQLDNLAGDVTLLSSAFNNLQLAIGEKVAPALRPLVKSFTNTFSDVGQIISEGGGLGQAFGRIGEHISAFAQTMTMRMSQAAQGMGEKFTEGLSNAVSSIANITGSLREHASRFVDVGIEMALSLAQGLANAIPSLIQNIPTIVSNIAGIINDNAPKLITAGAKIIVTLAKGIIQAIPTLIANIPKILQAIWNAWTAFGWMNLGKLLINGIKNGLSAAASNLPSILKNIFSKARDVLINIRWSGIGKTLMEGLFTGLRAIATKIPSFLQNELSTAIDVVKAINWLSIGTTIVTTIGNGLLSAGSFIIDTLSNLLGSAVEAVGEIDFSAIGEKILETLSSVGEAITSIDWGAVGASVIEFIGSGLSSAGETLHNILVNIGRLAVYAFRSIDWAGVGTSIINFIVNGVTALFSAIPTILSTIATTGATLFRSIPWSAVGSAVINFILSGLRAIGSTIGTTLRSLGTSAMNAFKSINWKSLGTNIINGIVSGISNGAHLIADAARNAAKKAFDAAKNFLGIQSPSKLFRDQIGKMMALGMGLGFENNIPIRDMQASISDMVDALSDESVDLIGSMFDGESPYDNSIESIDIVGTSSGTESGERESYGGEIIINVYPSEGQDERAIADMVAERLGTMYKRRRLTYA